MKFFSTFGILTSCVAAVSAHSSMVFPAPRGHPQNPNAAVKDYNCITAPLNPGAVCSGKTFPCGGYPMDTQITQVFHAGDIVSVKFWNSQFPNGPQPGDAGANQARHNGGLCEFALSYDGGVTYTVIGTYHETCPDIFFDWKVKIPENAPSCDNPGKCIFSWSWINAVGNREFYQNCADIKLVGNSTKPLPIIDITRANLPPQFPQIMTPPGDPDNSGNAEGSGPSASDVSANLGQNIGGSGGSAKEIMSTEDDAFLTPMDIPSSHQSNTNNTLHHRRRGTGRSSVIASSLSNFGNAIQSWTGNYGHTVSTYISDNISVPASFVGESVFTNDDLESHDGGEQNQHPPFTARSPPISIPRGFYGSFLSPISGSPQNSEYGTPMGASIPASIYFNDRRPRRHSRAPSYTSGHKFIDETLPLTRTLTKSSLASVPISVVQDMHGIPVHIGSTFRQSIFNSCNILIGIGILALPLGFRFAGWGIGLSLFVFCLCVTNYTAKLLVKCLDYDEGLHTYADMGAIAYGEGARLLISFLFSLELIASATALVILVGDSLHTIFPNVSLIVLKILAWMVMTPLTLMAIRYLSYFSLLGIFSAVALASVLIYDGLTKFERPGSLIDPMDTQFLPESWATLPMSFGLVMAGFTGHAVFPSVYRDMENPKEFPRMVNLTYAMTATVYFAMAVGGYLMFGNTTMQEITQNIMSTPGYNRILNQMVIWLVAFNPIAKYALTLNPINLTLEIYYNSIPWVEDWLYRGRGRRTALMFFTRILISTIVVIIAILFPGFDRVMGILGSFFSYTISAIFPCLCHLRLYGRELSRREKFLNWAIIVVCSCLATFGTIWAFLPSNYVGL
ncbi:3682_t:CDS:2 [Ambispora leptoticha]|uniref:3682_t:CDS:1 n=1 Tax=Ambispora leptoticha TaxID=144679 RepID=A0A9N8VCL7_9GLOM|nr:3682_t:CDS:2 [Ambispora leptoticha]